VNASLLDPRILDRVFLSMFDEVPRDLLDDDLQEGVLEGLSARPCIDRQWTTIREAAFRISVVDVVRLLGLILDRFVLTVLGVLHLEDLDMHLGVAVDHVQIAWGLALKLLDFEKDGDVRAEIPRRVGWIGPVRMGLGPGRDLVGIDDGDLLDLLAKDRG